MRHQQLEINAYQEKRFKISSDGAVDRVGRASVVVGDIRPLHHGDDLPHFLVIFIPQAAGLGLHLHFSDRYPGHRVIGLDGRDHVPPRKLVGSRYADSWGQDHLVGDDEGPVEIGEVFANDPSDLDLVEQCSSIASNPVVFEDSPASNGDPVAASGPAVRAPCCSGNDEGTSRRVVAATFCIALGGRLHHNGEERIDGLSDIGVCLFCLAKWAEVGLGLLCLVAFGCVPVRWELSVLLLKFCAKQYLPVIISIRPSPVSLSASVKLMLQLGDLCASIVIEILANLETRCQS